MTSIEIFVQHTQIKLDNQLPCLSIMQEPTRNGAWLQNVPEGKLDII